MFIDVWKRPEELLQGEPDVPMVVLDPEAEAGPNGNRALIGDNALFSGTACVEWLFTTMRLINERSAVVNQGEFLWENIYPKGADGLPAVNPSGKYAVRMWIMDSWRCVTVDDRVPVDLFGRSTLVGIRPLMIWPMILCKAVIKLMSHYKVLDCAAPDEVPAVTWLTGWERENLGVSTVNGVLYDRILDALRVSKEQALPSAFLRDRAAPERPPPRMIVLCGASGVGKRSLLAKLCSEFPERFGGCVSNTSRPPKEHEEDGRDYFFTEKPRFDKDVEDDLMLEHIVVNGGLTKKYRYGTSLQTVRGVAATGKLCVMCVNVDGIAQLRDNPGVDAYFIYVDTSTPELLRARLKARLKEDESTVQKRLAYAKEELAIADPQPSEENPDEPPEPQSAYHQVLLIDDMEDLYYQMKVAVSVLSPIIRNRLKGLPAYVLDYSDVIPANSTERTVIKPVVLAGPSHLEKAELSRLIVEEFPEVFAYPKLVTTKPIRPKFPMEDEPEEPEDDGMVHVTDEEFDAAIEAGAYAVTWSDQFVHPTLVYRYAIPNSTLEDAAKDGRLCLCNLTGEASRAFKESGADIMALYIGPSTHEIYEQRLRAWLTESDEALDGMLETAADDKSRGDAEGLFDINLNNDDAGVALESLKEMISAVRPDVIAPKDPSAGAPPKPVVVCGPSGVGKGTLIKQLMDEHEGKLGFSVSHTTRAPRDGEEDGVHYHFTNRETMEAEIAEGKFLEYADVHGNFYGTSVAAVQAVADAGKIPILDIDVQGARNVRQKMPDGVFCFVSPPSIESLEERLRARATEDDDQIATRVGNAAKEMEAMHEPGLFTDVIVNDELEVAYSDLKAAVGRVHPAAVKAPPKPLVVAGPVGSNKTAIFEELLKEFPDKFGFPLATTTREPGPDEIDGVHYKFTTRDEFEADVVGGKFLECTEVIVGYGPWAGADVGNPPITVLHGTSAREVKRISMEGKMPIIEADVAGAAAMKAAGLDAMYVFFVHPEGNVDEHRANLANAGEPDKDVQQRMDEADAELAAALQTVNVKGGEEAVFQHMISYDGHAVRYARFKEAIATVEPTIVPMSSVWGFGRPRWDEAVREYGRKPLRAAIVGPAASGKSTQAWKIAEKFDIPLIYPGDLLRQAAYENPTDLGREAKRYLDASKTVPDDFMMTLIKDRITQEDCVTRGWLLDGFPHNLYQAKALYESGHAPDKVIIVEVDHETVMARTEGRQIDPVTGRTYHKEFMPAEEGSEVASRLSIRHDDIEENVRNRLAKYDFSDAPLRSVYPNVSDYINGARPAEEVWKDVESFITIEDTLFDEMKIVPARSLPALEYEVLDVRKYRTKCCLLLAEPGLVGDSRTAPVWVDLAEISETAKNLLVNFRPDAFTCAAKDERLDMLDLAPGGEMIHVDSPEPVQLLVSLTVAPREPEPVTPLPAPVVLCGDVAAEVVTALVELYPAIFAAVEPEPEPEPEPDNELAPQVPTEGDGGDAEAAEEQAEAAEANDGGEGDVNPAAPTKEEFPGAKHCARLLGEGLCPVLFLDAAGVVAFRAAKAKDAEAEAAENDNAATSTAPATFVCFGTPPLAPPPPPPSEDEDVTDSLPPPEPLTFDVTLPSSDSVAVSLEALKGISAIKARLPVAAHVDTSVCTAILHDYDWSKEGVGPQRTVLRLATNTMECVAVSLPRGRHVLQLDVDPGFYFTANVRSMSAFDMGAPAKLLEEKQLAAPAQAAGAYPEMASGDWCVWFRRVFKCAETTTVSATLEVSDADMSPFARFAVIDNDGTATTTQFVAGAAPPKTFSPNEHGYTIMAYSKALTPISAGNWRVSALADVPFTEFTEMPTADPARFSGTYSPNYSHLVCRFRVSVKERALFALHFESDLPAGFTVTLTDPEEGWEEKANEEIRGGHKGHLFGTEMHRWDAYTLLTVPAVAVPATPDSKYYVMEVRLVNPRCSFEIHPNGNIPATLNWKMSCYSSVKETAWTMDQAREKYYETTLGAWNGEDKERPSRAEAALAKREEERKGENRPPVLKEVKGLEDPIVLEPEKRRVVRKGPLAAAAREAAEAMPVPRSPEPVVITQSLYDEREAALQAAIDESKARLTAYVAAREAKHEAREEKNKAKVAEFVEWRMSASQKLAATKAKRLAYLESLKPPTPEPEPEAEEGEGGDGTVEA